MAVTYFKEVQFSWSSLFKDSAELKVLRSGDKDVAMPRSSIIKQVDQFSNGNEIIYVGGWLKYHFWMN